MKNTFFIIIFVLFTIGLICSTINAQDKAAYDIKWTKSLRVPLVQNFEILKIDSAAIIYQSNKIISSEEGNGLSILLKNKLYRLDKKTKKRKSLKIKLYYKGDRQDILKIAFIDNSIHVISQWDNKKAKKVSYFDQTLNSETLLFNNDSHMISELDYNYYDDSKIYLYQPKVEINKNTIALYQFYLAPDGVHYTNELFNKSLELKSKCSFIKNTNEHVANMLFDYEGNLYVFETVVSNPHGSLINLSLSERNYVSCYSNTGTIINKQEVFIVNKSVRKIDMNINKQNKLACIGIFTNKNQISSYGIFSVIFSPNLANQGLVHYYSVDGTSSSMLRKINSLNINQNTDISVLNITSPIHFREDGGFDFVTQKSLERTTIIGSVGVTAYTGMGFDNRRLVNKNIYGDILVHSCSSDGSFNWTKTIENKQVLINTDILLGSYLLGYGKNDEMNVIYDTHEISETLDGTKAKSLSNKSKTIITTLDKHGEMTNKILFDDYKTVKSFFPSYSKSYDDGKYVIVGSKSPLVNSYRVGELTLK